MSERAAVSIQSAKEYTSQVDCRRAANAAHDICNQLQIIESALNLISRSVQTDTSSTFDEVLRFARLAVDRAGSLSRAIVDTPVHGSDRSRRVSIAERLVALPELSLLASASNILIEHRVRDDVPDVLCDPDALADAMLNIIVNARRAMPCGGRIVISVAREAAALDDIPFAVLRIADTGCGMPPEIAARAFEPKFTTQATGEGSGLGLAMVADFARSAGGVAELESRVGVGTVITLRLRGLIKQVRQGRSCR